MSLTHRGDGSLCTLTTAAFLLVCHQLKLECLEQHQASKCQDLLPLQPSAARLPIASFAEGGRSRAGAAGARASGLPTSRFRGGNVLELQQQKSSESRRSKSPPGSGEPLKATRLRGNRTVAKFRTTLDIWEICSKQQSLIPVVLKRRLGGNHMRR